MVGMSHTEQQRINRLVLAASGEYGDPILGLRFVLPPEIAPERNGDATRTPGIYLDSQAPNKSPTAKIRHHERLLTPAEAEEWAAMVDRFARIAPDRRDDARSDGYPTTNLELVRAWYAALVGSLGTAIEATEQRRMDLREVYAGLSGNRYGPAS